MFNQVQMTPVVKRLLMITVGIWFFIQVILGALFKIEIWHPLALFPYQVVENFYVWQLFSYMFLHALSPFHLAFNMLMLWFFGTELERHWGSKFFTMYYLLSGIGAAFIYCLAVVAYAMLTSTRGVLSIPVIGASGALFGLLLAYGIIFSERETYFMGLFPMKAKYFVLIIGAIDFASLLSTGFAGSEVAYLAHLGGLLSGFIILRFYAYKKSKGVQAKLRKKTHGLRLVVDNEKSSKEGEGPKYWN